MGRWFTSFCLGLGWLLSALIVLPATAAPPVDLEVAVEASASITAQQEWLRRLSELKLAGLTLRKARQGESPEIINRGTESNPRYKVLALLTSKEQLILKGGRFGPSEMGRLRQFFATLGAEGLDGVTKPKEAFGLNSDQLIALAKDLEAPIDFDTRELPPEKILRQIAPKLKHQLSLSNAAQRTLAGGVACRDELKAITAGTALAVLLRPYGLVLQPRVAGRSVELEVVVPEAKTESWPVGWPLEGTDRAAIPALMEFINVEIEGIELPQALEAIQERLAVPFLFDHNQLAKHGIEPAKIEVSVAAGRLYYKRILERILFQAKLKSEIRTDELGKPILWITTIKP